MLFSHNETPLENYIVQEIPLAIRGKIKLKDKDAETLAKFGTIQQTITRKIFNVISDKKDENTYKLFLELQKSLSKEYSVPVRVCKSAFVNAKGQRESIISNNENRILYLETKIKETKADIKRNEENLKKAKISKQKKKILGWISNQKQKLQTNKDKLKQAKKKEIHRMWGSKSFYNSQWSKNYKNDHETWRDEWNIKRNHHLYFVGSKDETCGNNICQLLSLNQIQLRLPNTFDEKYIHLDVDFDHKTSKGEQKDITKYLLYAIQNEQALTFTIFQSVDTKDWYVHITFSYLNICEIKDETIGVDLNYDLFSTSEINKDRNPENFTDHRIESKNKSSEEIDQQIIDVVHKIVDEASRKDKSITIEDLDLKKSRYENKGKKGNYKTHMVCDNKFITYLQSYAVKKGVYVKKVNPAYTSYIAMVKYMNKFGRSRHACAAYVIARQGLDIIDKLPSSLGFLLHSGEISRPRLEKWKLIYRRMKVSRLGEFQPTNKKFGTHWKDPPTLYPVEV